MMTAGIFSTYPRDGVSKGTIFADQVFLLNININKNKIVVTNKK